MSCSADDDDDDDDDDTITYCKVISFGVLCQILIKKVFF
jgi:hypothetical protein